MNIVSQNPHPHILFIATSNDSGSNGIYTAAFDSQTGKISGLASTGMIKSSMFLTAGKEGKYLYAANDQHLADGEKGGLSAFAIGGDGMLSLINTVPASGVPCHISTDAACRRLFAACYSAGKIAAFPLQEDGSIGNDAVIVRHEGKSNQPGADSRRQDCPHPHMIIASPDDKRVFVPDLGQDKVLIYNFDADSGALTPANPPFASTAGGAGPRHLAIHPSNDHFYVVNELDNTVTVFAEKESQFEAEQVISTLPTGFSGESYTAEIGFSPDHQFLIASNRGQNTLAVYRVEGDGRLGNPQFVPTGQWPQHFTFDPSGKWLLSADMKSKAVRIYSYDPEKGTLSYTETVEGFSGITMCLQFV